MTAEPLVPFIPTDDDPDWELLRARITSQLAATAAPEWTDHNAADPGITLAEAAAFGLADLHYRVSEAAFPAWPLGWDGWRPDSERHWDHVLPLPAPAEPPAAPVLAPLAAALAAVGASLEPLVRDCASRADAEQLLALPAWSSLVPSGLSAPVIAVLRGRLVRQCAQEHADAVADAVASADATGGTQTARDARAAEDIARRLPLWADEIAGLVRRERARLAHEVAAASAPAITGAVTPPQRASVAADLVTAGLTAAEASAATALARIPAGMTPEDLEATDGSTTIWPPHPIQVLTCEPVVAEDYATRARQHPQVGRAWAVRGRLAGVTWHGLPVLAVGEAPPSVSPPPWPASLTWTEDPAAAAITLVVDRVAGTSNPREFLREVLAVAIGTEVRHPFPIWRDDMTALDPRRLIGDEVGAAILRRVDVVVSATLVLPVASDTAAIIADVAQRIETFFEEGRPERHTEPPTPGSIEGPWPPAPQPAGGWFPGEAIRFTEVVQAMVGNPQVIGVKEVFMKVAGASGMVPASAGSLPLPAGSVPVLAAGGCLDAVFAVTGGCTDA